MAENNVAIETKQTSAETMRRLLSGLVGSARGVIDGFANGLAVAESSPQAATVDIATGAAFVGLDDEMTFYTNTALDTKTIAANASGNDRIDTIVVEVDLNSGVRTAVLKVVQGTPAGSPVAPTLTQTAILYQFPLADVEADNGFSVIADAKITDRRANAALLTTSVDVQSFDSGGTWTKPTGATLVVVAVLGGGGGGGSGRRGAASSARNGGGGGGGGNTAVETLLATNLGATETVTVAAGGAGAGRQGSNDSDGSAGTVGGNSSFGTEVIGIGGHTGNAGDAGSGAGGLAGGNYTVGGTSSDIHRHKIGAARPGSAGAVSNGSGAAGDAGARSARAPGGGGAGGGITSADSENAGGDGGEGFDNNDVGTTLQVTGGGASGGAAGANGSSGGALTGDGGGGGGGDRTPGARDGGQGGTRGGGGGGGGASENGVLSGAGGAGGIGRVQVWSW